MTEYRLMGTENPRTGEEHLWMRKDGKSMSFEDVANDLFDMQEQLHHCRGLLETAVDAWECGMTVRNDEYVVLADFKAACLTGAWYEAAKQAAGGGDE